MGVTTQSSEGTSNERKILLKKVLKYVEFIIIVSLALV